MQKSYEESKNCLDQFNCYLRGVINCQNQELTLGINLSAYHEYTLYQILKVSEFDLIREVLEYLSDAILNDTLNLK